MKRSEAIKLIANVYNTSADNADVMSDSQAELILRNLEASGMLPPTQVPSLVEDTYNGGIKHGPAQRIWDKE